MIAGRWLAGMMGAAALSALLAVAPAVGASDERAQPRHAPAQAVRTVASFTPAAADPRLAAAFARSGLDASAFRFTPSEQRRSDKAVTVAVRARSTRTVADATRIAAAAPTVGLAPIAYNLGVAVGWKRFAVSGDVSRLDFAGQPGGREAADVAVSYSLNRFSGQVRANADRPIAGMPKLVEAPKSYSLDVGGSYALTRNLDVTAGVRYKSERDRLVRLQDDRRDSQAVYVGTAFRF